MNTLHYVHGGLAQRSPVAVLIDATTATYYDGAGWSSDIAQARRYPMTPLPAPNQAEYAITLPGDWPRVGMRVLVYEAAGDASPAAPSAQATLVEEAPGPSPARKLKVTSVVEDDPSPAP